MIIEIEHPTVQYGFIKIIIDTNEGGSTFTDEAGNLNLEEVAKLQKKLSDMYPSGKREDGGTGASEMYSREDAMGSDQHCGSIVEPRIGKNGKPYLRCPKCGKFRNWDKALNEWVWMEAKKK